MLFLYIINDFIKFPEIFVKMCTLPSLKGGLVKFMYCSYKLSGRLSNTD